MNTIDFPFQAIETLRFNPKPQPLSASLRPIYRIALITLILRLNCHGKTASLLKLQFFNWILKSSSLLKVIEDRLINKSIFTLELIHLDPMVNLALKYAIADKLILVTGNSKYKLTGRGYQFVDRIIQDRQSILKTERDLLVRIGQRVSEVTLRKEVP